MLAHGLDVVFFGLLAFVYWIVVFVPIFSTGFHRRRSRPRNIFSILADVSFVLTVLAVFFAPYSFIEDGVKDLRTFLSFLAFLLPPLATFFFILMDRRRSWEISHCEAGKFYI